MQETELQTICRAISKDAWYKGYDGGPYDPPVVAAKGQRRIKGATPLKVQYAAFIAGYTRGEADKLAGLSRSKNPFAPDQLPGLKSWPPEGWSRRRRP